MQVLHATKRRNANAPTNMFSQLLHAAGPDSERSSQLELYAWLIGDWEFDITTFPLDGTTHTGRGEIHAGWVLQGRAIQDVWMIPRFRDRKPGIEQMPGAGNWYGTTLRVYDPNLDAWRILWNDPATNFFAQQIAKPRGSDIVQEGLDPRGGTMRWTFFDIEPDSFHWMAERSTNGTDWRKEVDIRARRPLRRA
jgi:hypothetical protein